MRAQKEAVSGAGGARRPTVWPIAGASAAWWWRRRAVNERRAVAGAGGGKGGANSELHAGGSETQWREELARALGAGVLPGGARRT